MGGEEGGSKDGAGGWGRSGGMRWRPQGQKRRDRLAGCLMEGAGDVVGEQRWGRTVREGVEGVWRVPPAPRGLAG